MTKRMKYTRSVFFYWVCYKRGYDSYYTYTLYEVNLPMTLYYIDQLSNFDRHISGF